MANGKIQSFKDLLVWQKSRALVINVYDITKEFPKEEVYGLTNQIRRCAVSIPSNIAEGFGRGSRTEYARFLRIAKGSLFELETQMDISGELGYLDMPICKQILNDINEVGKMLGGLLVKLEGNNQS